MCGEQSVRSKPFRKLMGSSPRVRGTADERAEQAAQMGIIPACAGNRRGSYLFPLLPWDHPRVCGEQQQGKKGTSREPGSSPRVRGTERSAIVSPLELRIIPACAGNSMLGMRSHSPQRDHPRVCGEQEEQDFPQTVAGGSSPRVRGTVPSPACPPRCTGIIPACAGNRRCRLRAPCCPRDHPRVCGEQSTWMAAKSEELGSSPRVRGTVTTAVTIMLMTGIIPACAGNRTSPPS